MGFITDIEVLTFAQVTLLLQLVQFAFDVYALPPLNVLQDNSYLSKRYPQKYRKSLAFKKLVKGRQVQQNGRQNPHVSISRHFCKPFNLMVIKHFELIWFTCEGRGCIASRFGSIFSHQHKTLASVTD